MENQNKLVEQSGIEAKRKMQNAQKKVIIELDGNEWCAHYSDFINIQESPCGFGSTREAALRILEEEL